MGYRNNQFYQLGEPSGATFQESTLGRKKYNYYHPSADNPRFIYPDRTVRTYEVDERGELVSKREVLKRGFMRSIARTSADSVKKVQFQFNPQTITQNVRMTDGLLNFFQQDPGQYAQPMAGNTDMAFTIMFDRTMEINNPVGASTYYSPTSGLQTSGGNKPPSARNPWETGDPQYVGVLRDIAALYGVIGQGVSEADVQGRIQEIQAAIKAETLGEETDVEEINKSLEQVQTVLDVNIGNYALLVPRPVRVVLSSLYMVEGFVTNTSVTFTKFNTAFVPIQAVVNITMRAMHVGFAKKDTFLTYSLAEAEKIAIQQEKEEQQQNREVYKAAEADMSNWFFQVVAVPSFSGSSVLEQWENGSQYVNDEFYIALTSQGTSLDSVKDLMKDGGATLKVWYRFQAFTDLVNPGPRGQEKASPRIWAEYVEVMTTTDQVKDRDDRGGGGSFFAPYKQMRKFTPGTQYGGLTRLIWEVRVELDHNGVQMRGYGVSTDQFTGTQSSWEDQFLVKEVPITWSYFGDTVSGTPVVGSGITPAGTPSGVD